MKNSEILKKAKEIILSAKGKTLLLEERKLKAIELAALMLTEAKTIETVKEKKIQDQLAKMMQDENGKSFLIQMTDQSFRSCNPKRTISQINFLLNKYGVPKFLNKVEQLGISSIEYLGSFFPSLFASLTKQMIRKKTAQVILPGEPNKLIRHIRRRKKENVRVNLNHLGEAILGEDEAKRRLNTYLSDLEKPEIDYVSIKISTICSQLNLLSFEETLNMIIPRLSSLYRAARQNKIVKNGMRVSKFVNLDMEEFRDLNLTVEAFKRVLEQEEFRDFSAGIVLQSYIPDSYLTQQELTLWAIKRIANGGAPIKIRIVKGANLAMEQVEASLRMWPQAPYEKKEDVDANYKRMLSYGAKKEHAKAVHLGVASHNLFDIAYALILASENEIAHFVSFEMLEGMADHMRRVVQELSGSMLLYCPAATKEEFQNAVAYLVRRLDENTAPGNFLREAFSLMPGSSDWKNQAELFASSCDKALEFDFLPRRTQNRFLEPKKIALSSPFENEADTDFSLTENRKWAERIIGKWLLEKIGQIPLHIADEFVVTEKYASKASPYKQELYRFSLADHQQIEKAVQTAELSQAKFGKTALQERMKLLSAIAHEVRSQRADLIGAMVLEGNKSVMEADAEISEAIDFAEYYLRKAEELAKIEEVELKPKGVALIASPWNFPCSIPLGGITAALMAGNSVLFKPAKEAVLTGFLLAKICWKAGVSPEVLQFIMCEDEKEGSQLIQDPRIQIVVLTGATATAKLFYKLRPGLHLLAETGGKNAMIVTSLADRDLTVKELVHSAFSYSGQKCSACSLAICEREVYEDLNFREQLKSAASSLKVGPAFHLSSKVTPLIGSASPQLHYGLTKLEEGEEWLLKPVQDKDNPNLWSPGIRLHVKPGSISHQTEFFGPVLSLMCADNLEHAVELANGTAYGLTSGLQSLDEREQAYWMDHIEAGNLYINRSITGAIVQRQPFGGCKESSFGAGLKAGGPNYLIEFMNKTEKKAPIERNEPKAEIKAFRSLLNGLSPKELELFDASIGSYAFYWNHLFSKSEDVSLCVGQDNFLKYVPRKEMAFRVQEGDSLLDIARVAAAAKTCGTEIEISASHPIKGLKLIIENEKAFIQRIKLGKIKRVRLLKDPSEDLKNSLAENACNVVQEKVFSHGRFELLHYLREVALSIDYHRYGNLGAREKEKRTALVQS
ncbi:MAG TPA: bifunctional proline dehydrogenase/L-glutamate gamma-semialdehyde dehydrogenase [Parachlamydiaceae bacterium]|nr:bifunctional proline dehydrogenase/L-glutamate gamma-semialdehyde dehydrogenase [Parachlamydiaceae bacterium]